MTSTVTTGALLSREAARLLPDGKARGPLVDHRASTSVILILAASEEEPREQDSISSKRCSVAQAGAPAPEVIADKTLRPNWNCHWKKRIAVAGGRCNFKWLTPVRHVMGQASRTTKHARRVVGRGKYQRARLWWEIYPPE